MSEGMPRNRQADAVAVVDFGSQYSQLIARRVREANVYCEIIPWDSSAERVAALSPAGFILSGGPSSVYDPGAPFAHPWVFESGKPVLAICYGMQLLAHQLGGKVAPSSEREYGFARVELLPDELPIFAGLPTQLEVWMSHGDRLAELPAGFRVLARTS